MGNEIEEIGKTRLPNGGLGMVLILMARLYNLHFQKVVGGWRTASSRRNLVVEVKGRKVQKEESEMDLSRAGALEWGGGRCFLRKLRWILQRGSR